MRKALLLISLAVALGIGAGLWMRRSRESGNAFHLDSRVPSSGEGFSAALQQTVGERLKPGHRVELLENGAIFGALTEAIGRAESSVHIEIYIWTKGAVSKRVIGALRARRPGVACRVLLDAFGSGERGDEVDAGLREVGCELRIFRPGKRIERNHRKLAILDGRVGFTGGFGIDDRWSGDAKDEDHWRDSAVRVEGPSVADLQTTFAEDWQEASGELLPPEAFPPLAAAGPSRAAFVRSSAAPVVTLAERLTQLMLAAAHQRLLIENAYFVPGGPVLELLVRRAREGVAVRILVPGKKSDSKFSFTWQQREYGDLVKSGVRIWEFQPTMMHAKTMVVDGALSVIGSVNLDPLSLDKLEEGALVVEDAAFAAALERSFANDCARAQEQR